MECPEFREMLLYDSEHLEDGDIPHRTKLPELIHAQYMLTKQEIHAEMHVRVNL